MPIAIFHLSLKLNYPLCQWIINKIINWIVIIISVMNMDVYIIVFENWAYYIINVQSKIIDFYSLISSNV